MAIIKAFKGVRPNKDYATEIAALPYDVYNRKEAKEIVSKNPYSFLKVDRPETFFDDDFDMYSQEAYEKARDTLNEMIDNGLFIQDEKACFYIYKLTMYGISQIGLVACTSIDDYLQNKIKKHELTREDKEKDRINHVDYCDANTGPIFLTYKAQDEIDNIVNSHMGSHQPLYDFVAEDDIVHTVWMIDENDKIQTLINAFNTIDSLYIADGHHRAASAVKVGLKRREENKGYKGDEEFNFFLSVIFPHNQLKIMDYNRVVKDLNGLTKEAFLTKVEEKFIISKAGKQIQLHKKGTFGLFLDGSWYMLEARSGTYEENHPVLSLDVSILQTNLLTPILGIQDPRKDHRIDFVGGIRGYKELIRRTKTDMTVAFAMVPTAIEELIKIADANELMPPKSTWFEPKLRSGLFIHLLK